MDIANIYDTFDEPGFGCTVIQNESTTVTLTQFKQLIIQTQSVLLEHGADYDGFMFLFSGHGGAHPTCPYSSVLCLSDGQKVPVRHMVDAFRNGYDGVAKALVGKPRIYFIQACRGNQQLIGLQNQNQNQDVQMDGPNEKTYHPDADMLLIQSNTARYVSYRDVDNGSYLITAICEVMDGNAYGGNTFALDDAVYAIKHRVSALSNSKQAAVSTSTLQKKIMIQM